MSSNSSPYLFTFILEYFGGTYVAQVRASSVDQARLQWAQQIDVKAIHGLGVKSLETFIREIAEDSPVRLEGLHNVWCLSALIRGKLALIQVVQTDMEDSAVDS